MRHYDLPLVHLYLDKKLSCSDDDNHSILYLQNDIYIIALFDKRRLYPESIGNCELQVPNETKITKAKVLLHDINIFLFIIGIQ